MGKFELVMPKMGESIIEATITRWLKEVGEQVEEDDPIVEIATDKVDSEIPSPVDGVIKERLFEEGDVVEIGKVIAIIETEGGEDVGAPAPAEKEDAKETVQAESKPAPKAEQQEQPFDTDYGKSDRFYSPLVKNISRTENISRQELDAIKGSGKDGRVTKRDVLGFLDKREKGATAKPAAPKEKAAPAAAPPRVEQPAVTTSDGDEVIEMDRMRKMIADHMVMSKRVSPHVTSFIDVDVTSIVNWRNKVKADFLKREGEKITFTPIFIEAAAKVLKEYPRVNASVDGTKIIHRKKVNIGMAAALPNGNLIVPVLKDVDKKNLLGITKDVNDLAVRARENRLQPDEIQGGTFTLTNFGSFDSLTGTPIISQPQVAILGVGAIRKKPVVIETTEGDVIGIRHIMILSLAYDHRVVDGALGGMYLRRLKEVLENFDVNQSI
ncbi:MAG: 2-oxo acid dehydrogenase subunit E2 [Bacteroidales bacterium]|nr:2-oxo acid dehydrogenase subunit E2 [Bacteroidales bacterium]MCF8350381.1 2-oxo acid dehydrogenase subunit E2 [Bacteroidales bacterium]MCF8375308.1 2-oxo acid dehydrogenase subunit E2 [Bacteroidales bacterium]MCF8400164.1 2-oxo acid dehydrogenase subunit E2 [Bacteroidales bacterium]